MAEAPAYASGYKSLMYHSMPVTLLLSFTFLPCGDVEQTGHYVLFVCG
jgi:hypothetical protein